MDYIEMIVKLSPFLNISIFRRSKTIFDKNKEIPDLVCLSIYYSSHVQKKHHIPWIQDFDRSDNCKSGSTYYHRKVWADKGLVYD